MSRNFLSHLPKKSKDFRSQSIPTTRNPRRGAFRKNNPKAQATSVASADSVRNVDTLACEHCGKNHFDICRLKKRACFRCGSFEHFLRDCPNKVEHQLELKRSTLKRRLQHLTLSLESAITHLDYECAANPLAQILVSPESLKSSCDTKHPNKKKRDNDAIGPRAQFRPKWAHTLVWPI
ncbi:CBS domain-containing protein CBSX5-like [Gossypium australe]|uniref:CBS domain-containing protein CBSX5-like n=1 Tax=Gossypium australe TaxID=47621 RepID=A0A5B6V5H8_9ROSI|nr:CBS domain-containing protein CBSX5-like [Gossypium australe]